MTAKRPAECHPDRPHLAKGLCESCYRKNVRETDGGKRKEQLKQNLRRIRAENPTHYAEYQKKWRSENRERVAAASRKDYDKRGRNYRRERMSNPAVRAATLATEREWHRANPEKSAALAKAKKAKRRAAGTVKAADILAALDRQGRRCFWCAGDITSGYHADHFIPVAKGGKSTPENIVAACPRCNLSRSDKLPNEWSPPK